MKAMLTYVTSFYPIRQGEYIQEFKKLASTGVPILVFTNSDIGYYENVKQIQVPIDLPWFSNEIILPVNRNHEKDTPEFLCLMLMKLWCMKEALKYTDSAYLAWIDFRVFHVVQDTERVQEKLKSLTRADLSGLTKIASPGCWQPIPTFDILNSICWRFCGGFLVGPRESFEPAYNHQSELVKKFLPHLTWEVNYWCLMEEHFEWYFANHNDSLLLNFPFDK
jgi:hypothetical protein